MNRRELFAATVGAFFVRLLPWKRPATALEIHEARRAALEAMLARRETLLFWKTPYGTIPLTRFPLGVPAFPLSPSAPKT